MVKKVASITRDGITVGFNTKITAKLYLKGKHRDLKRRYMMWRKRRGLQVKDSIFKALIRPLLNKNHE